MYYAIIKIRYTRTRDAFEIDTRQQWGEYEKLAPLVQQVEDYFSSNCGCIIARIIVREDRKKYCIDLAEFTRVHGDENSSWLEYGHGPEDDSIGLWPVRFNPDTDRFEWLE